jgi:hypothetical protein
MIEDLIHLQLSVHEPEKACRFLIVHFGFFKCDLDGKRIPEKQGFLICNNFGDRYLLTAKNNSFSMIDADEIILVNTDDCLRDYHLLNIAEIRFAGKPKYTSNGLEATIIDDYGNRYTLLEKRDYSEI